MWYIIVIAFLTIFSVSDFSKRKITKMTLFNIMWLILTFMLVFRYGQGTDYYEYFLTYDNIDSTGSLLTNVLSHGEIGWYILNVIGNRLGMSFFVFVGIISLIEMVLIHRFILLYSPYKVFSLLLFYPAFYLTGCYSILRQGLVLCLFLGIGIPLLVKRKKLKYLLLVLLLVLLHTSAIVLAVLPFLSDWKKNKYLLIVSAVIILFGIKYIESYFDLSSIEGYIGMTSIAGVMVRTILFIVIWVLYRMSTNVNKESNSIESLLFKIYLFGFIISLCFVNSATISQRLTMPLKATEVVLLPILVYKNQQCLKLIKIEANKLLVSILFLTSVLIMNVEFVKNIYSYIEQGNYYSWVTPINYPYSSVFDQNKIRKYISHFDGE